MSEEAADPGALEGLRVLDLTRYLPGPYCTLLLADLGADVVKVEEPPIGDQVRMIPPAVDDESALHAALNRGKRSLLLDLRREEGAEVVRRLAARSDVLVEGFRPGVLARRGLGAEELRGANPRLVYCSLTGYGQDGPLAERAGHDIDYVARGGLLAALVGQDGPVQPATQIADVTGGLVATIGILAALAARERTGRGQVVDVSLLEGVLALMTPTATRRLAGGPIAGELSGTHACYNLYRCRDGRYLAVGALEPKFWAAFCRALGHEDRVGRQWESGERRGETLALFRETLASRDRDEWLRILEPLDACVEPVLDLDEALAQPQARRSLREERRGDATLRTLAPPLRLSETPPRPGGAAPAAGQHAEEVLAELGYGVDEVARLRSQGILA